MFKNLPPGLSRRNLDFYYNINDFFFNKNTISYFLYQNFQISSTLIKFFKYFNFEILDINIIRFFNKIEINLLFLKKKINKKSTLILNKKKVYNKIKFLKFFNLFLNDFKKINNIFFFKKKQFIDLTFLNLKIKFFGFEVFFKFINKLKILKFLLFKINKFCIDLNSNDFNLFKKDIYKQIIRYILFLNKFIFLLT